MTGAVGAGLRLPVARPVSSTPSLSQRPAAGSPSLVQLGPGSRFLTSCSLLLRNSTGQLPHKERRVLSVPRRQVDSGPPQVTAASAVLAVCPWVAAPSRPWQLIP